MTKKFSNTVMILLVIFCWPAAIIYYILSPEKENQRNSQNI